ncbi:serine/threonine-protein kinase, partial [Microcoleus anatoxicus]
MYPEKHWRKLQGQKINNQYHLQEFLGCGGYGAVYKADEVTRNRLIREVAIKLIAPEEDETKAEKQLTELQAAVNIHHENLICSYTSGECEVKEDEYLFIVMEIAETTLEKQRKTGKISPAEAIEIVKATAAALNYLHQSNPRKVHRDIKPANLLYAADKWKLSDFGLLREISVKNSARTSDRRGTALYVPPEAYDGVVATGWDMWSLGIMTAEILTGIAPFTADTEAQLMKKIMEEEPEIDWSKIPEPFTAIVRGCLKKERENRWTAEQVLTTLAPPVVERSRNPVVEPPVVERSRNPVVEPSPWTTLSALFRSRPIPANPVVQPSPSTTLRVQRLSFQVITVNNKGQTIKTEQRQAEYFSENLGRGVNLEMVQIPGGTFMMGSPDNEQGRHD